jgi:hypothetical protein
MQGLAVSRQRSRSGAGDLAKERPTVLPPRMEDPQVWKGAAFCLLLSPASFALRRTRIGRS